MESFVGGTGLEGPQASAILAALTDTLIVMDEMGRMLWVTSDSGELLGHDRDYWVGHSALDLVHPDDLPVVVRLIQEAFTSAGRRRRFASLRIGSTGRWFPVDVLGFNRLDFEGSPALIISIRDTARELQVAQARQRAERTIAEQRPENWSQVAEDVASAVLDSLRPTEKILLLDISLLNAQKIAELTDSSVVQDTMTETTKRLNNSSRDHDIVLQTAQDRLLVIVRDVEHTRTAYRLAQRTFELCEGVGLEVPCSFQVGFALASAGDDFAEVRAYAETAAQFSSEAKPDLAQQQFG